MQKQKSFIASILFMTLVGFSLTSEVFTSQGDGVAKVIVMRGQIKAKLPSGDVVDIKKGMWLKEGTVVQSASKSFCRLLFIDKSTMNLGADSQMVIDQFPESESGIITLMKGQVRSKVTKDYMDIKDKDKSKLFIKTKTAAMGVRGTDFQVNYSDRNTNTSLITFSGSVAMARLDERGPADSALDRGRLEQMVSSREAVMVREGELSAVTKNSSRATIPQKMSRSQLEGLKSSSPDQSNREAPKKPQKKFRNPVPPGMDAKKFANDSKETVKESVGSSLGTELDSSPASREPASTTAEATKSVPAEGLHDPTTGEYAPRAGAVLDLKTVNIVEPPKGAIYDPITETYVIPPELGSVDPNTGEYVPPEGMTLTDDGYLKRDDEISRSPASEDSDSQTTEQGTKVNSMSDEDGSDGTNDTETQEDILVDETNDTEELESLTEETLSENEQQLEEDLEQELIENTRGKASFDFQRVD